MTHTGFGFSPQTQCTLGLLHLGVQTGSRGMLPGSLYRLQQPIVPVLSLGSVMSPSSVSPIPATSPTEATAHCQLLHSSGLLTGSPLTHYSDGI